MSSKMSVEQAMRILARNTEGERDEAVQVIAREMWYSLPDEGEGLGEWLYNGEYKGTETVESLLAEWNALGAE